MTRTLLLTALFASLLVTNRTEAQIPGVSKVTKALPKVDLGIKVGANFQELSSNSTFSNSYKGGVVGGAFLGVTKNKIGVEVEALVKNVNYSIAKGSDINTVYLDVPVLFEYKLVKRLWLQVGPQFSDLLSAKESSTNVASTFKSTDFSGVLGLQANLPVHLIVGARYLLGFVDINNHDAQTTIQTSNDAWRNRSFQIYVGFRFL